jgi:hypothetical protein
MLEYSQWRDELFGYPPDSDPFSLERSDQFDDVTPTQAFDFVDRVLLDPEVHNLFSKDQLGIGINTIYCQYCSDLPFLYTTECDEERRVTGIDNLVNLYKNFFERYCTASMAKVGSGAVDGRIGFICYMFWDIFVLYSGNATPKMQSAAISVMRSALDSRNDSCLASAIHGLGHWASDVPEAVIVLKRWLGNPTTENPEILNYARSAMTGRIL